MTPFQQNIILLAISALLTASGWLIVTQISTNKNLAKAINDAISEFKTAMAVISVRDKTQEATCALHSRRQKEFDDNLKGIKVDAEAVGKSVAVLNNEVENIWEDVRSIRKEVETIKKEYVVKAKR